MMICPCANATKQNSSRHFSSSQTTLKPHDLQDALPRWKNPHEPLKDAFENLGTMITLVLLQTF